MNPLKLLEDLVVEHGSAKIQKTHIDFLKDQITVLQCCVSQLESTNSTLRERLRKSEADKPPSHDLNFKEGLCWREGDDSPFCPGCYDGTRKAVRLTKQQPPWDEFGDFLCPICKQHFNKG